MTQHSATWILVTLGCLAMVGGCSSDDEVGAVSPVDAGSPFDARPEAEGGARTDTSQTNDAGPDAQADVSADGSAEDAEASPSAGEAPATHVARQPRSALSRRAGNTWSTT